MTERFTPTLNDYVLSPETQVAIDHKATELYEKRIAPYAENISPSQKEAILNFQKLIFTIDDYGECSEKIDSSVLNSFWKQAEQFLSTLGIDQQTQSVLLQDIKDFASVEASTRNGKKLSEYGIRMFYFLKSCDVRLQRHLIRLLNQRPAVSSPEEITKDLLEEIEDDLDDTEEDKSTPFNGNRLLEILNSGDNSKLEEYITFIDSLPGVSPDLIQRVKDKINKLKA